MIEPTGRVDPSINQAVRKMLDGFLCVKSSRITAVWSAANAKHDLIYCFFALIVPVNVNLANVQKREEPLREYPKFFWDVYSEVPQPSSCYSNVNKDTHINEDVQHARTSLHHTVSTHLSSSQSAAGW